MKISPTLVIVVSMVFSAIAGHASAQTKDGSPVIEIVTLKLKDGVTATQFLPIDQEIQTKYISKRPGFISRESAPGADHTWLVIVHWRSVADADASMKSFSTAPASAQFMSMIVPESMVMTRYGW